MDRNSLIGLLLIGIILVFFTIYNAPTSQDQKSDTTKTEQKTAQQQPADTTPPPTDTPQATKTAQNKTSPPDTVSVDSTATNNKLTKKYGLFAEAVAKARSLDSTEQFITVENEFLKLNFSKKGGRLDKILLKKYKTYDQKPVYLLNGDSSRFGYQFFLQNKLINTNQLYFESTAVNSQLSGKDEQKFKFRAKAGAGRYIEQVYTVKGNSHEIDYQLNFVGFQDLIPTNTNYLTLIWKAQLPAQEKGRSQESQYTTLYYKYDADDEVDYISSGKEKLTSSLSWVSFKQQFFNSTLIQEDKFLEGQLQARVHEDPSPFIKTFTANLVLPYEHKKKNTYNMHFYFGPNKYKALAQKEMLLEEIIPLGWGILGWINIYFIIPFFNFLNAYIVNYGLIILVMTVIIKMLLLPLTYRSYLSMAKMKIIKPELDELKEKYKDDTQKFSQAQLKLFRKAGVNPLGGCLPMLLQMPILIAMYRFFPASIELRQEGFLWATDLSTYDSILSLPFNIPFYGDHVSLFTLLMAISMVAYTRMNSQMTSGAGGGQMKIMQYFMPIFMLFIFNSFSAALTYYFLLSNLISFGQQYVMKTFFISDEKIHKQIQERKKKPRKKSKLQKKLEKMAKDRKK